MEAAARRGSFPVILELRTPATDVQVLAHRLSIRAAFERISGASCSGEAAKLAYRPWPSTFGGVANFGTKLGCRMHARPFGTLPSSDRSANQEGSP